MAEGVTEIKIPNSLHTRIEISSNSRNHRLETGPHYSRHIKYWDPSGFEFFAPLCGHKEGFSMAELAVSDRQLVIKCASIQLPHVCRFCCRDDL